MACADPAVDSYKEGVCELLTACRHVRKDRDYIGTVRLSDIKLELQQKSGDIFIGLRVPEIRKIAKKYSNLSLSKIQKLLIAKVLEKEQIREFLKLACDLKLDVLLEVHDTYDLKKIEYLDGRVKKKLLKCLLRARVQKQ